MGLRVSSKIPGKNHAGADAADFGGAVAPLQECRREAFLEPRLSNRKMKRPRVRPFSGSDLHLPTCPQRLGMNYATQSTAAEAVYPWRNAFPLTGPISPLQKNPARGRSPKMLASVSASWSEVPKSPLPRPAQEKSKMPIGPDRPLLTCSEARTRSSRADFESRS